RQSRQISSGSPPGGGSSRSITVTSCPSSASSNAAPSPPGPAPITQMSATRAMLRRRPVRAAVILLQSSFMSVDVDLLGAVALRRAGVAQTLRRGKERALLARLALAAPKPISIGTLVADLWP